MHGTFEKWEPRVKQFSSVKNTSQRAQHQRTLIINKEEVPRKLPKNVMAGVTFNSPRTMQIPLVSGLGVQLKRFPRSCVTCALVEIQLQYYRTLKLLWLSFQKLNSNKVLKFPLVETRSLSQPFILWALVERLLCSVHWDKQAFTLLLRPGNFRALSSSICAPWSLLDSKSHSLSTMFPMRDIFFVLI